jgi:PhnB protein
MEAIVPYLIFNGDAVEALAFYTKVFDGKILFQQTFGESPMESNQDYKNKIMHATFQADDLIFMASDRPPEYTVHGGTNMSLSLNFKTVDAIEKTFAGLSDGAKITMPLQDTFWGARFGTLTDKFGISWMFNHDYEKKEK